MNMVNLNRVVVERSLSLPLRGLDHKTYFQGASWAADPRNGAEWFVQLQARPHSGTDVEDCYAHLYSLSGDVFKHEATMLGIGFGHCQTVNMRVSALGRPWLWLGLETYSGKTQTGTSVHKVLFREGTVKRGDSDEQRPIYTGYSSAIPLHAPDWTVGIRRISGGDEVYEWHDETALFNATKDQPSKPTASVRVSRRGNFQSACLSGTSAQPFNAYRLTGATGASDQRLDAFGVNGGSSTFPCVKVIPGSSKEEEPEAVVTVRGEVWLGKQTHPSSSRVLAYLPLAEPESPVSPTPVA